MNTNFLTTADETLWRVALPTTRSVFGSLEFGRIAERQTGHRSRLFVLQASSARLACPVFLRPIPAGFDVGDARWDTVTPEYTGPLLVEGSEVDGDAFGRSWAETCRSEGIVAEFAHLHPWNARLECLDTGCISYDREIVYVDLTAPIDKLREESFNYACRKNLRRAQAEGIEVWRATSPSDLKEFHRIYTSTMDRNAALQKYYFSLDYFSAFLEQMPDNCRFLMASHRGKTIAGTLYLFDDVDVYSYLGGADHEYQQMRPSNAVIYEIIRWAQAHGKKRLILGGGYKPDDGIFRFKASFSPLRARFNVYRKIHLTATYERLIAGWSATARGSPAPTSYFPKYRAPVESVDENA